MPARERTRSATPSGRAAVGSAPRTLGSPGWRWAAIGILWALGFVAAPPAEAQTAYCGAVAPGSYASGFNCAPASGTPASLSISTGTSIATTVGAALRTAAQNADSTVSISNTQIDSNTTALANGIQAVVTGGFGNAGILFSGTLNAIRLGTVGDNAVQVQNNTGGSSSVVVNPGTRLDIGNLDITGNERDGIEINATGSGDASVLYDGSGTVSVADGNGLLVKSQNGGSADVRASGGVTFNIANPTPGGNFAGIHTSAGGTGGTSVTSAATINGTGTNAYGIYTQAVDGAAFIDNSGVIKTDGTNGFGIRAATSGIGDILVDNSGAITTTGQAAHGIYITSPTGDAFLRNDGALTVGTAASSVGSRAIYINVNGDIDITGAGDISVLGNATTSTGYGMIANATLGGIAIDYSGSIAASGNGSGAIRADAINGDVSVDYTGSRIETFNDNSIPIYASSRSATGTVAIDTSGTIITHSNNGGGDGTGSGAYGLEAISYGGDINVVYRGPSLSVNGSGAAILAGNAYFTGTGLGTITVENDGDILALGNQQQGIRTFSTTGAQIVRNAGSTRTFGATGSPGIQMLTNGAAPLSIVNDGTISTRGTASSGIEAISQGGSANVTNMGSIGAGWGSSAGILLGGTASTVTNAGAIEALSDIALQADGGGFSGTVDIINDGRLTGAVTASTSAVTFENNGVWDLRNFADTTGSGVRDTLGVAISNFGTSGANAVDNGGTIALLGDGGAASSLNTSGSYRPFGLASTAMAIGGPAQGQLLGVTSFVNSGVIDLRANASAGDVLVISGGAFAGTDGGGVFLANGGSVRLDTVLNEGGVNTSSDILVLDSARLGSAPTAIDVRNLDGEGALTVGNGIPLVQVLNRSASPGDVFVLDAEYLTPDGQRAVVAGAYAYTLQHNGVGADSGDGNWYLRSDFVTPDGEDLPRFQPGTAIYEAYPRHLLSFMTMPTMQQRVGNRYWHGLDDVGPPCSAGSNKAGTRSSADQLGKCTGIETNGIWTRVEGEHRHFDPESGANTEYDTNLWKLQAGFDGALYESSQGGILLGGLNLQYGSASSNVRSLYGNGGIDTKGYGLGGTLTWLQEDGLYVDGQLSAVWFDSDLKSSTVGRDLFDGDKAFGYAASVETGKKIDLDSDWTITPQAQLVYSGVNAGTSTDEFGARVSIDGRSLLGRLGIAADRDSSWLDDTHDVRRSHVYGIANLYYEFLDPPSVDVAGTEVAMKADRLWGGVGIGGSYNWGSDKYSVYGEALAKTSLASFGDSYSVQATVGLRVRWQEAAAYLTLERGLLRSQGSADLGEYRSKRLPPLRPYRE